MISVTGAGLPNGRARPRELERPYGTVPSTPTRPRASPDHEHNREYLPVWSREAAVLIPMENSSKSSLQLLTISIQHIMKMQPNYQPQRILKLVLNEIYGLDLVLLCKTGLQPNLSADLLPNLVV